VPAELRQKDRDRIGGTAFADRDRSDAVEPTPRGGGGSGVWSRNRHRFPSIAGGPNGARGGRFGKRSWAIRRARKVRAAMVVFSPPRPARGFTRRPSSGPSPEFCAHHQVEPPAIDQHHFRSRWRRIAQIDKLLVSRLISPREWLIADQYRDTHARAHRGTVRTSPLDGTGRPSQNNRNLRLTERQLHALEHLAAVRRALGAVAIGILEEIIVADSSWAAIARQLGCDAKSALLGLSAAKGLAAVW
jgi:hypothetical protein